MFFTPQPNTFTISTASIIRALFMFVPFRDFRGQYKADKRTLQRISVV
jgi:hypothetical protein